MLAGNVVLEVFPLLTVMHIIPWHTLPTLKLRMEIEERGRVPG